MSASIILDILTMVLSVGAFVVSIKAYNNSKKGQQYSIIDKILGDVNRLDIEVGNLYKLYYETKNRKLLKKNLDQTLANLFNKLDWISFLINNNQVNDDSLKGYVYPMIKGHYEKTYLRSATPAMKQPSEFKNFKELYEKIKDDDSIIKQI